jgi:hypothetical protein
MKKFTWIFIAVVAVLVPVVSIALPFWRTHVRQNVERNHLEAAQNALKQNRFGEALKLAEEHLGTPNAVRAEAWSGVQIDALAGLRNVPQLTKLFEKQTWPVSEHEPASLLVARSLMAAEKQPAFTALLDAGLRDGKSKAAWAMLRADDLIKRRQPDKARLFLDSLHFTGDDEATKICRLALLAAGEQNYAQSWTLLESALQAAPNNADVHSFRAQMLEAIGRLDEATQEYEAAMTAQTANPLLRDQLADFHLRQGHHDAALRTLREAVMMPHPDYMRLKALFWSRVVNGASVPESSQHVSDSIRPLITLLESGTALKPEQMLTLSPEARERPEAVWLAVLEMLRQKRESDALAALRVAGPRVQGIDSDLYESLMIALEWRISRRLPAEQAKRPRAVHARHAFIEQVHALLKERDAATLTLLESPHVWSACLMACGWRAAALSLWSEPPMAPAAPAWLTYGMAQCLRLNQRHAEALTFIESHALASDELRLLHAELLLLNQQESPGLESLQKLQWVKGPVGERARMLLQAARISPTQLTATTAP